MSYLLRLTFRLGTLAEQLPESSRRLQIDYLRAAQREDGGFAGRQGGSDPYYTSFALRGLALLGALDEDIARRCAAMLKARAKDPPDGIDLFSLVFASLMIEAASGIDPLGEAGLDRVSLVAEKTTALVRADGGYAKSSRNPHSSTYVTFLAIACRQLVDLPPENEGAIIDMILNRQRPDGGFVELPQLTRGATNPTAAAVALLHSLDALPEAAGRRAAAFLVGMQNVEGGFRANTRIPVADLLSTFSAAAALDALGVFRPAKPFDRAAMRRYAESLQSPGGGYRGGAWDDHHDVEYTFYGLGAAALASATEA